MTRTPMTPMTRTRMNLKTQATPASRSQRQQQAARYGLPAAWQHCPQP
jgi:hypothetical protein